MESIVIKDTNCSDVILDKEGQTINLAGWVHKRRDHGVRESGLGRRRQFVGR